MQKISVKHEEIEVLLDGLENCSVSSYLRNTGHFYELGLLEALSSYINPGDFVVDIGAHIGNHSIFLAKVLGARVIAIEANPEAYSVLKSNVESNGLSNEINALNVAVTDKNDTFVQLTPLPSGDAGTLSVLRAPKQSSSIRCKTVSLDVAYSDYFKSRSPVLIKLDVEGAEAQILSAATQILKFHAPVLATEVQNTAEFDQLIDILLPLNYSPVSIHNATPTVVWESARRIDSDNPIIEVFRYAIEHATAYNQASVELRKLREPHQNPLDASDDIEQVESN